MYEIGAVMMHPSAGVCKITEIRTERRLGEAARQYYVLKPLYERSSTVLTPVGSEKVRLRPLLSAGELQALLEDGYRAPGDWIEDNKLRQAQYTQVVRSDNPGAIIRLIAELLQKQEERQRQGKKLQAADERLLAEAERRIDQEFAYALDIQPQEVAAYIRKQMQGDAEGTA